MTKISWCLAILMLFLTEMTGAVVKGRWDKVDTLEGGALVTVSTRSGEVFSAVFESVGELSLTLAVNDQEKTLPKSEIRTIVLETKQSDPSWDGLVWGASIGGGIGAALGAIAAGDNDGFALVSRSEGAAVVGVLGAGIGGLVGFVADKTQKKSEVLYEAR